LFFEDPVQVCVHLPSSERDPPFLYCGEGAEGSSDAVVELARVAEWARLRTRELIGIVHAVVHVDPYRGEEI
jgi:hypothetical protein